jgi:hypothetical protein
MGLTDAEAKKLAGRGGVRLALPFIHTKKNKPTPKPFNLFRKPLKIVFCLSLFVESFWA